MTVVTETATAPSAAVPGDIIVEVPSGRRCHYVVTTATPCGTDPETGVLHGGRFHAHTHTLINGRMCFDNRYPLWILKETA